MAVTIAQAQILIKSNTQAATSGLTELGGKLALLGAAAVVAGVAFSVKMAGDFQEGMTTLVTGAGEAQSNIKMVSDGILQMAVSTGTTTKQLTDGMFMIESAGYHGAEGLNVMKVAAEGAKVGNADLGVTANALTTIMKDYGIKSSDAAVAMNTLTAIVSNGKTTLQDLAGSISSILPTSSALHVSLNDVAGAMATMTGEGVAAADGATYLRQMLMALASPAKGGAKALKEIGLTTAEVSADMKKSLPDTLKLIMKHLAETYTVGSPQYVAALKNIAGGSKQMQGMLDLTGTHLADFQTNVQNVAGSVKNGGDSVAGWALVQDDFNFKMSQAAEVVQTTAIRFGTMLLPMLSKVLDVVTPLAASLGAGLTGALSGLSGAASPVSGVLHDLGTAMQSVMAWFTPVPDTVTAITRTLGDLDGPAVRIGTHFSTMQGTIGRVSHAFITVKGHASGFQTALSAVGAVVGPIISVLGSLVGTVVSGFGQIVTAVQPMLPTIKGTMIAIGGGIRDVGTVLNALLVPAFHAVAGLISGVLVPWWLALNAIFTQDVAPAMHMIAGNANHLGSVLNSFLGPAVKILSFLMQNMVVPAINLVRNVIKDLLPIVDNVAGTIAANLAPALGDLQHALQQAAPFIHKIFELLNNLRPVIVAVAGVAAALFVTGFLIIVTVVRTVIGALGGIFQILGGLMTFLGGFWSFVTGLFTLNGTKISQGLSQMWDGIKNVFMGAVHAVIGIVTGFIGSIVNFFEHLADHLVGHSVIPDMISAIVGWFVSLPGKVLGMLAGFVGNVIGFFTGLAGKALGAVGHLVTGAVGGAAHLVTGVVGHLAQMEVAGVKHFASMALGALKNVAKMNIPVVSGVAQMGVNVAAHVGSMWHNVVNLFTEGTRNAADLAAIQRDKVSMAALEQKDRVTTVSVMQAENVIAQMSKQRDHTLALLKDCKNGAERHALEQRLAVENAAIAQEKHVVASGMRQHAQYSEQMRKLAADAAKHAQDMHNNVWQNIADLPGKFLGLAGNMIGNLASGITGGIGKITGAIGGLVSGALGALGGLVSGAAGIAGNMISGLANGLKNGIGTVLGSVKNLASNVWGGITSFFGIHSPSTLFASAGQNMMLGWAQGINDHGHHVVKALTGVTSQITAGIGAALNQVQSGTQAMLATATPNAQASAIAAGGAPAQSARARAERESHAQQGRPFIINMDGRAVARGVLPHISDEAQYAAAIRSM